MGMRTIRWRNGQCPGRNGQWAERIAHAGSEAVRLVPLFQRYSAHVCSLSRSSAFLHLVLQDLEPMGMRPATPLHSTKSINQSRRYKDSHSSCDGEASCLLS